MNSNDFQEPEKEAKLLASSMGYKSHLDLVATNIEGLEEDLILYGNRRHCQILQLFLHII